MMDRRSWPWRKKFSSNNTNSAIIGTHLALDGHNPNSAMVSPPGKPSSSVVEAGLDTRATLSMSLPEKKRHLSLLENTKALEALVWKEQGEEKAKALAQKLEDAEKDLVSKESMVKQHAKVAEEAVAGWEKAEAEAASLKQQLALAGRQRSSLEGRIAELENALKSSLRQSQQIQEEQQRKIKEVIDRKMQEWDKVRAEMEKVECDLRQRVLASEAQSCAMAKSLEERAKAIAECQEVKTRAEMEAGLLQVKLESQAKEMAAVTYELRVLTKELEIRNQEKEFNRKAADAAHKQHLEDVKKMSKLDSECQRLRSLVRKKLPGPAAIAQMRMELEKNGQTKRRRSLGSLEVGAHISTSSLHSDGNVSPCQDLAEKLLVMEEETKTLREALAKRSAELQQARLMCVRAASKLSAAEEQLESLQGTPRSVRSAQNSALDSFILCTQAMSGANSERLDDEVSCAESWASALITELALITKGKQPPDSCGGDATDSTAEHLSADTPKKSHTENNVIPKHAMNGSPSPQDYSTLKILAGKDAQLQSANLMCKDAMAKLSSAEAKLGHTWISQNPRSNVEESVNSVGEAHDIMSKLDRILDEMRIAVASVGDTTDDDTSDNGASMSSPSASVKRTDVTSNDLDHVKEKVEMQARTINELQMQVSALETTKTELEAELCVKGQGLEQVRCELEAALARIEALKASELSLQSQRDKLLAEEEKVRGEMQFQLDAKESEVSKLRSSVASLGIELSDLRKNYEASITRCEEELDRKLQSYANKERNAMAATCRFEDEPHVWARKEREVAVAKEKLAECQRTVLVLGKQLTAFTSPSSASFDSTMSLHCQTLDSNFHEDGDRAYKSHVHRHQYRPLAYNSVNPHPDGTNCSSINPSTHISDSRMKPPQSHMHGGQQHYLKPRRIHSDLSYRTDSTTPATGMTYSVAEHLQMDDGVSSFYDSRTESAMSSPSSQYTSPSDKARPQRSYNEGLPGVGVRASLAKSLERVAAPNTVDGKRSDGGSNGVKSMTHGTTKTIKNNGHGSYGGGGGKGNKSLSRFFGRSKK